MKTPKYYTEKGQEEKWQLVSKESETNLCDMQAEGTCSDDKIYYTDDQWGITYWCSKHFEETVSEGAFVEVK